MWVMDYPQLERIYYALVAGFDVYGTLGHQLAVRLYMDGLREEGESYFLGFMPEEQRRPMMESWYKGVKSKNVSYYDAGIPAKIEYKTDNAKREFIEEVVNNRILPEVGISFDKVNYRPAGGVFPPLPNQYETMADYLQAFQSVSEPGTEFFSLVDNFNANVVYIRIRKNDGTDAVVSLIINRWHDNVTFMFNEKKSLDPSKDNADFLVGFHGSYPNYFIDIQQDDLSDFFNLLANLSTISDGEASKRFHKWAINRANKDFWEHYDWFQERFNKDQPVQSGLFDLNRYYYEASVSSDSIDL